MPKLDSEYACAGRMLSADPEVRQDVATRPISSHERDATERETEKPHLSPCPNPNTNPWLKGNATTQIKDLFWNEYKLFDKKGSI